MIGNGPAAEPKDRENKPAWRGSGNGGNGYRRDLESRHNNGGYWATWIGDGKEGHLDDNAVPEGYDEPLPETQAYHSDEQAFDTYPTSSTASEEQGVTLSQ